jgi:hypothetical protein
MTQRTESHRTILMPPSRAKQIALAATASGVSSEQWIQATITAGLLSQAASDGALAMALMRSAGISWDDIRRIVKGTVEGSQP